MAADLVRFAFVRGIPKSSAGYRRNREIRTLLRLVVVVVVMKVLYLSDGLAQYCTPTED
jgi:hypothetical protein